MKLTNKSGIYCIFNIINGKRYIGLTTNLQVRKSTHYRDLGFNKSNCTKLQRAYNKYGKENLFFYVVEYCSKENLSQREIFWINYYQSVKHGYNVVPGGISGFKLSDEVKSQRGKKIKEFFKNKGRSKHHTVKCIFEYSIQGDFIKKWDSIILASESTGIPYNTLRKCLKGHLKRFKNTMWFFDYRGLKIESYKRSGTWPSRSSSKHSKSILQYDINNNFIKEWDCIKDAAEFCGVSKTSVISCLKGRTHKSAGYKWKYK
jgi:group I intron endonuclease